MESHFREPITGILVVHDPREALDVRKMALSSGILLTCVTGPELAGQISGLPQLAGYQTSVSKDRRGLGVAVVVCNGSSSCVVKETNTAFPSTPVLAIVDKDETPEGRAAILRAGAIDVLSKPFSAIEFTRRLTNVAQSYGYRAFADRQMLDYEDEVRNAIGEILLREYEALYVLGKASEYKDQETGAHIARVAHYSLLIARMLGLERADQETVFHASALHDVGKIGIPDSILLKPGRLDTSEQAVMKTHTTNGHGILKDAASSFLLTGAMIALTHHERIDGAGYPMGLRGENIPLYGRIVCVADVFDALTTRRPYKSAWSIEDALQHLWTQRGTQFDPDMVDAFVYNEPGVRQIFHEHSEEAYPDNPRVSW